jgi:hypothetical protein
MWHTASVQQMQKWVIIGAILMAALTGTIIYKQLAGHGGGNDIEVNWEVLGQLDYTTGNVSAELKNLDRKKVKIPGFMVPLEDTQKNVKEFLLVPTPQACIHVPPPPPNQMVYVTMNNDDSKVAFGPIWVYGTLKLTSKKHMYGEASFEIDGDFIEPYR